MTTAVAPAEVAVRASPERPPPAVRRPEGMIRRPVVYLALAAVLAVANGLLAVGATIPLISALVGVGVIVGIPTYLLYTADLGAAQSATERLGNSLMLAIFLIMGSGLMVNTVLPHLGVRRPLDPRPVVLTIDALCLVLGAWAYRRHPASYEVPMPEQGWRGVTVVVLAVLLPVMAGMGAVRLNNGRQGQLTYCMLLLTIVVFALLFAWRERIRPGVIPLTIFCVSLALLLMTSLRGWYTTGHDIQREVGVFELTKEAGAWRIGSLRDPYNACLSITILPTMISRWAPIADPYVYKVLFQFLFAFCPVLCYRLVTRFAAPALAVVATIAFVSFVTFFQDLPMLNRQEIALMFLVAALLALFNERLARRGRRMWFALFALGMVVSHYSTTYVTIAILLLAWSFRIVARPTLTVLRRVLPRIARRISPVVDVAGAPVLGLGTVAFLMVACYGWSAPLTRTDRGLRETVQASVADLRHGADLLSRSSDTSYSLFSTRKENPAARLERYRKRTLGATAEDRAAGVYFDEATLSRYPVEAVEEELLPLTPLGRNLSDHHVNVVDINYDIRIGAAHLLQILVAAGLLHVVAARRRVMNPHPEFFFLALATLIVILFQIVMPDLSQNYGLLRAFQQGLVILDVFLVAGAMTLLPGMANSHRLRFALVLNLVLFASATGMFTQAIGGYGPQLHLNNAGEYYDIYYLHTEEIAGIDWLKQAAGATARRHASGVQMDQFTFDRVRRLTTSLTGMSTVFAGIGRDIHPLMVRRDGYVFLGYSNIRERRATTTLDGDLVTYGYPSSFLDDNKDLVYSNGGASVYR